MDLSLSDISAFFLANLTLILRLIVIIVLAWLGMRLSNVAEKRFEKNINNQHIEQSQQARLKTLMHASISIVKVVIIGATLLMILLSFGINITPILASAGVAGLAVSLGAQSLIKDYIGGALILIENTYKVGEMIEIEGIVGTVERIELRTTKIRDFTGKLITIPNGDVRILANNSRDWSRAVVEINISVDADLGKAIATLQAAAEQASQDETLKAMILEAPQIQGWNNLSEWAVQVRINAKTLPSKQLDATAILRKVTLEALQNAGIELAVPPMIAITPTRKN